MEGEPAHKDVSSGSEDLLAATCCKTVKAFQWPAPVI